MNRRLVAVFVCCLLAVVAGGPLVSLGAQADDGFRQTDIETDDVLLAIDVGTDGDAAWRVEYRTRLDTDDREQAFEELQADIDESPGEYRQRFGDRMNATAADAAEATGREMHIEEMAVTAERRELPQEYGVVTYSFRWTNFAAVDGDRLVVGDAIDSLFLDEETTLLVGWPDDDVLFEVSPTPSETRENSVIWNGPTDFGSGQPRLTVGPDGAVPDDTARAVPVSTVTIVAVVALLTAGIAAIVFVIHRRRNDATAATEDTAETTEKPDDAGVDTDLLSNEEQVLELIEANGGRMKQKTVAEELGWTAAKTSQVTKRLREEGTLEGFRLGRENVLSLPDDEVSSSDDETR